MNDYWQKLTITADKNLLEIISADILQISNGMIECVQKHIHYIELNDFPLIRNKINNYKNLNVDFKFEEQKKENWHLAWKNNFHPIKITDKLTIIPNWEELDSDGIVIKIKPGMAFGTGHHETTNLILEQLVDKIEPGVSVLDLGTGSGILAIAAKKLGAKKITAVEFDKDCEENFYENLVINDLENKISVYFEDVLKWKNFNYDLILANINKSIIKKIIPILSENIKSEILLTGLLIKDKSEIISILNDYKFTKQVIKYKGEWMLVSISNKK